MYQFEELSETELWAQTVKGCSYSSAFHSLEWRDALEHSFKQLEASYFLIKETDTIVGALPCFVFSPTPMTKMCLSMPFNLFGGPLVKDGAPLHLKPFILNLNQKLNELAHNLGVCETVITLPPLAIPKIGMLLKDTGYEERKQLFTHLLKTDPDYSVLWNAYNKRVRGAVRKAEKKNVVVRDSDSEEDLKAFYEMYLAMMQRFGSAPKPLSMMRFLQESSIAKLAIAERSGVIIAGVLYLFFNHTATPWCEASLPEFLEFRPNNAIIHYIIRWACQEGYDWVDLGTSPPEREGLIAFKEQWRAKQYNYSIYAKVYSPWKRGIWTASEPVLRKIYGLMQRLKVGV